MAYENRTPRGNKNCCISSCAGGGVCYLACETAGVHPYKWGRRGPPKVIAILGRVPSVSLPLSPLFFLNSKCFPRGARHPRGARRGAPSLAPRGRRAPRGKHLELRKERGDKGRETEGTRAHTHNESGGGLGSCRGRRLPVSTILPSRWRPRYCYPGGVSAQRV